MSDSGRPFWIEVLTRREDVIARHKVSAAPDRAVDVGRGYDNDIVIDDPYVAARHVRIARDENGGLVAEDLGSANGLFVGGDRRRVARASLEGGRIIRIGRTYLRARETDHAVSAERISRPQAWAWPIILGIAGATLALEALNAWLLDTGEPKLGEYVGNALALSAFVAVWSTGWAIVSRVFSGRARFERHLLIAVSGALVLSAANDLSPYAAFAFSRPEFTAYRYVFEWLAGGMVCFLHLRVMTRTREGGRSHLWLTGAGVAALALMAIGTQTLSQWESSATSDRQRFISSLKPPLLRLTPPQTEEAFFADVSRLKASLERARSEPAAGRGNYAGDDD